MKTIKNPGANNLLRYRELRHAAPAAGSTPALRQGCISCPDFWVMYHKKDELFHPVLVHFYTYQFLRLNKISGFVKNPEFHEE
jgi:hypothetical protein